MARKTSSKKAQRVSKTTSRARTKGARPKEAAPDNTAPNNTTPGDGIAATKVFGITELLERIILFSTYPHSKDTVKLSPLVASHIHADGQFSFSKLHLFVMQGVSKDFCGTIQGSAQLKRLMFLLPYENEHLETLAASYLVPTLPFHEPVLSTLDQIQVRSGDRQVMLWDLHSNSTTEAPILAIKLLGGNLTEEGSHSQVAFDDKVLDGWLNPEASCKDIKLCNAAKAVPLTVKIVHNSWILGPVYLSWLLQGDDTLGYLFDLFRQLFQQLDEWVAATVEIEEKRDELEGEKIDTQDEWHEARLRMRAGKTVKAHLADVEHQEKLWDVREKEIDEEEEQANRKWDNWTRAVWIEQNNRRLAFEFAKKS